MIRLASVILVSFSLSGTTFAEEPHGHAHGGHGRHGHTSVPPMDMTTVGPWSQPAFDVGKLKKEIEAFLKSDEELMKARDFERSLERIDFPVYVVTDDSDGIPLVQEMTRERYVEFMHPVYKRLPQGAVMTGRTPVITVLSASLASFVWEFSLKADGKTFRGKSAHLLVKRDGRWRWKMMAEPGWGNMPPGGIGGSWTAYSLGRTK